MMNSKERSELLRGYDECFSIIMDEARDKGLRRDAALRAATLAEVLRDRERLSMALTAAQALR